MMRIKWGRLADVDDKAEMMATIFFVANIIVASATKFLNVYENLIELF